MALTDILEAFETELERAEQADTSGKAARKIVNQIEALFNSVDDLPEDLRPTLPTADEVATLRGLTGSIISAELTEMVNKAKAALTLGEDAGLADFDYAKAKELVERYSKLMTSSGKGRNSTGTPGGSRGLNHAIRVVMPDGKTRTSNRGDWTNIRWQIHDDGKGHGLASKEQLDAVFSALKQYDNDGGDPVEMEVMAGDGSIYTVHYPG